MKGRLSVLAIAAALVAILAMPVLASELRPHPDTPPYLDSTDGISPSNAQVNIGTHKATIRLRGTTGDGTTMAFVQIDVEGMGDAEAYVKPQQTILIIDDSGSMEENDPSNIRLDAARSYIDIIQRYNLNDEIGIVRFSDTASLLLGLSTNYDYAKMVLSQFYSSGSTNMRQAMDIGDNELIPKKRSGFTWNYILLTDGCWNTGGSPQAEVDRAGAAQVRIFTIGLGEDTGNCNTGLDSSDLRTWSTQTNGLYYPAPQASNLTPIFKQIAKDIRDVAGYAPDAKPMLRVKLTDDIETVTGSFNIAPSRPAKIPIGNKGLDLEWDRPATRLKIGEVLTIKFLIQGYREGKDIPVMDSNLSIMQYTRTDGNLATDNVDQLFVDIFKPPNQGGGGGGGGGGPSGGIIPNIPITQESLAIGALALFPFAIVLIVIFLLFARKRRKMQEEIQRAKEEEERKKRETVKKTAKRQQKKKEEDAPKPVL